MKHALRKYISSRGSALFMVVSTMSALIVLVTAMYLSVLSSRQVQFTVFNQEQAYVSSTAISDIIQAYLNKGLSEGTRPELVTALLNDTSMPEGGKLSTNGNGFKDLTGLDTDSAETIYGAYDITFTRMKDDGVYRIFDMAVTVANNGTYDTTHTLMAIPMVTDEVEDMNETFAATGYIPNDVWIDSGIYYGSMYFDSEYTRIGDVVNSGGGCTISCEMRCAGSLVCDMKTANNVVLDKPTTWVVGNSMLIGGQPRHFDLGGDATERGQLYVGGDLVINHRSKGVQFGGSSAEPTDVYVVGDVYLTDIDKFYGNLYVGGNLYFCGRYNNGQCSGNIYMTPGSHVYIDDGYGNYYNENDTYVSPSYDALCWNNTYYDSYNYKYEDGKLVYAVGGGTRGVGPESIKAFQATLGTWDKSTAIDYLNKSLIQTPFYLWKPDTTAAMANEIDINFDLGWESHCEYIKVIDTDCTINEITCTGNQCTPTIIFDTGDDPDGQLVVRLGKNNYNWDGVGGADAFCWAPERENGMLEYINILTIGCGSLVIDVPAGVNYQATNQEFMGHIAWFYKLGGSIKHLAANGKPYFDINRGNFVSAYSSVSPYIHHSSGCTDCGTLTLVTKSDGSKYYTCPHHGGRYDEEDKEAIEDSGICPCNNRLQNPPTCTYGGETQKANVNIYLVSSSESATISFSGDGVMNNLFFGFVYAPYMTYMDEGGGGGLKNVGGLIVSDYILRGAYTYIQCYPDLPLKDIIGDDHEGDGGKTNKPWRVYGV